MTIKEENWRDKLNKRKQLENRPHKEMEMHVILWKKQIMLVKGLQSAWGEMRVRYLNLRQR